MIDRRLNPEEATNIIRNASVIFLMGGTTLAQMAFISEYGLTGPLQNFNGVIMGISAGAINMGKTSLCTKATETEKTLLYDGIGLVDFTIEPHFDPDNRDLIESALIPISYHIDIYCLCDNSAIIVRPATGICLGGVRILSGGSFRDDYCKTSVFPLSKLKYYRFVVIFAKYNGQWLYSCHKQRNTWETAGGHIEPEETALEAAKRELWEETGATEFDIYPLFDYSVHIPNEFSNGQVFFANIRGLGSLPESEMSEVITCETYPDQLTYPEILPVLFNEVKVLI